MSALQQESIDPLVVQYLNRFATFLTVEFITIEIITFYFEDGGGGFFLLKIKINFIHMHI